MDHHTHAEKRDQIWCGGKRCHPSSWEEAPVDQKVQSYHLLCRKLEANLDYKRPYLKTSQSTNIREGRLILKSGEPGE